MDTIFLVFMEQKCSLEQRRLVSDKCDSKRMPKQQSNWCGKEKRKEGQSDEMGATVPPPARLPPSAAPAL